MLAEIEPLRTAKKIGSSLQAKVVLSAAPSDLAWLRPYVNDLPMLFIVSEVELRAVAQGGDAQAGATGISIERSSGVKCERCWRYVPSVSMDPEWAGLCDRCFRWQSSRGPMTEVAANGQNDRSDAPPRRPEIWLPVAIVLVDQATKALVWIGRCRINSSDADRAGLHRPSRTCRTRGRRSAS